MEKNKKYIKPIVECNSKTEAAFPALASGFAGGVALGLLGRKNPVPTGVKGLQDEGMIGRFGSRF